ncbi:MAG: ATP-dependent sacrificial sulfur transferase LarE [Terriglobia bacterium]
MIDRKSKLLRLREIIAEMESAVVAFSGGVDSSFLQAVTHNILGSRAHAVTARSETYPTADLVFVQQLVDELGFSHRYVDTAELQNEDFTSNPPNRCYYCKDALYGHLNEIARGVGSEWVLDGTNVDDLADYRPGREAGKKHGIRSPLVEAGLTKAEIRTFSRELDLPTWDKPAAPCLASRFPYGTEVNADRLRQVRRAEEFLSGLGLTGHRVRHHGDAARIETTQDDIKIMVSAHVRTAVVSKLKQLGYNYVALDLEGYRTGSLNEVLRDLEGS